MSVTDKLKTIKNLNHNTIRTLNKVKNSLILSNTQFVFTFLWLSQMCFYNFDWITLKSVFREVDILHLVGVSRGSPDRIPYPPLQFSFLFFFFCFMPFLLFCVIFHSGLSPLYYFLVYISLFFFVKIPESVYTHIHRHIVHTYKYIFFLTKGSILCIFFF